MNGDTLIQDVWFDDHYLFVELKDRRRIGMPLAWYPRLTNATPEQRLDWQLIGAGHGIHWPAIDEDLSAEGILLGLRAPSGGGQQ